MNPFISSKGKNSPELFIVCFKRRDITYPVYL
jgi:hypothetical protein